MTQLPFAIDQNTRIFMATFGDTLEQLRMRYEYCRHYNTLNRKGKYFGICSFVDLNDKDAICNMITELQNRTHNLMSFLFGGDDKLALEEMIHHLEISLKENLP